MGRSASKKKGSARGWSPAARVLLGTAGLFFLLFLFGRLEPYWWFGGLLAELGFHLALAAAVAGCCALALRLWLPGALLAVVALALALPLAPLYRGVLRTPQRGPVLRIATADLAGALLDEPSLLGFLGRERPDALALTGLRASALGARVGSYRVVRGTPPADDLALLVQSALVTMASKKPHPYPSQIVRAGRCQARLVAIALPNMLDDEALTARRRAVDALSDAPNAPRSIWMGQLGSRAEAADLRRFEAQHGLRDSRLGHGRVATAPGSLGALGLPRSHVLVHGWISVREVAAIPPLVEGADRTVSAVLELTEPRCRFDRASAAE